MKQRDLEYNTWDILQTNILNQMAAFLISGYFNSSETGFQRENFVDLIAYTAGHFTSNDDKMLLTLKKFETDDRFENMKNNENFQKISEMIKGAVRGLPLVFDEQLENQEIRDFVGA